MDDLFQRGIKESKEKNQTNQDTKMGVLLELL